MDKSVDYMVHEFSAVRTGKASPGLVENVDVHAYGSTMKLKQLALITNARVAFARCSAFRRWHGAGHREGTQGIEDRNQPCG